jgi:LysM repeat protein
MIHHEGRKDTKKIWETGFCLFPGFFAFPLRSLCLYRREVTARLCGQTVFCFSLWLMVILLGCTPAPIATATPSPTTCLGFLILHDAPHTCTESENHALVESLDEQITLEGFGASIVIQGQIEITQSEEAFTIQVLSGTAVLGAKGRNRVVSAPNRIEITLLNGLAQAPSEPIQITLTPSPSPTETSEIAESDSSSNTSDGECLIPDGWEQTYTVKSGDTLAEIADAYNLRIDEIAEANCLDDPSRLRIGQVLHILGDAPSQIASTVNPTTIAFRADSYSLSEGECTILRWDAFNVAEVRLVNGEILQNSFLEVCLTETTTYTLQVTFLDGTEAEGELTITVEED